MEPRLLASHWTVAGNCHPVRDRGISPLPLEERVTATAEAGYAGLALNIRDLLAHSSGARPDYASLRRLLAAHGLEEVELDSINDWSPDGEAVRRQLFEAAGELGARHVKIVGDLTTERVTPESVDRFGAVAAEAARAGTRLAIEPMPFSSIPRPTDAIALIESVRAANAGLLLDLWHIARGGVPYSEIAALPQSLIFGVELCDAQAEMQGDMITDTCDFRKLCGEGDLDPQAFVASVRATGYDGAFTVEIMSIQHRALAVTDAAAVSASTTMALLDALPR